MSVAITSIKESGGDNEQYLIYILYEALKDESIQVLLSLQTPHCKIEFVDVSKYIVDGMYSLGHYSKAMYYRVFIPEILTDFDKVLYLDGDIVVRKPIRELYETELGDKYLAAALNIPGPELKEYLNNCLELDETKYFNSGVLLINCNAFRKNNVRKQFIEFVQENKSLKMPDQDALNSICRGNIVWLDNCWNAIVNAMDENILPEYAALASKSVEDSGIIHFAGERKPWNNLKVPCAKEWYRLTKKKYYRSAWEYFSKVFYSLTAFYFCGKAERLIRRVKVAFWKMG